MARPMLSVANGLRDAERMIGDTARLMHALATAVWLAISLAPQDPQNPEKLFDGASLRGWRGDPAVWSVRDGCLVGSTVGHPVAANTFLIWEGGEVGDFEFSAEVRLEGDNNSGVQYRSRGIDGAGFGVAGYQADIHGNPDYLGMLYEERGAGILCRHGRFVARDATGQLRDLGGVATPRVRDLTAWHTLRIVARGNLVWHELDGELVAVVQDDLADVARAGILALQVHAGPPMTVWWKNLTLRRLPREELAALPVSINALRKRDAMRVTLPKGATTQWLWDDSPQDDEELFFRREFTLPAVPSRATLRVTCDNHCRVAINGERVAQSDRWEVPVNAEVAKLLRAGDNVIAVQGSNDGGVAALALRLEWQVGETRGELVSDGDWRCSGDDPDGWDTVAFDDSAWSAVKVLGAVGQRGLPWSGALGEGALGALVDPFLPQVAVPAIGLSGPMADDAALLLEVPRSLGSWVVLGAGDKGRLYASDQARGLYRITPAAGLGETTTIEKVDVDLDGCQGLCWFRDSLYAVVNGRRSGLYRLTDSDGDDRLDKVELLRKLDGGGEHGPHAVVPAPDGENLLVLCGNHTKPTEFRVSRVPTNWAEDRLLPRLNDPNGHAVGILPPGGYVCRVEPDGDNWVLLCCGFRNAYDLAVLPSGDVVAYDADMEWDMGLPWYRPTRVLMVQEGVDYGWRHGSNKWYADYPDAPPALCDIGPGSPTGLVTSPNGVLALDWTFGTAWTVGFDEPGQVMTGRAREAFSGVPLPLTDAVVVDGRTFVLTGGRGLPSTLLALSTPPAAKRIDTIAYMHEKLRRVVEREATTRSVSQLVSDLGLGARGCVAARIALERRPVAEWRGLLRSREFATDGARLQFLLALAKQGSGEDLRPVMDALGGMAFVGMAKADQIAWLRVHALALLRLGPADDQLRAALATRLLPLLPSGDDRLDGDLVELLAYIDAPGLLDKAVPLLTPMRPATPPAWAEVAARNANYGGAIEKMLAAMPPTGQIAIANALRTVERGWTLEQRRILLSFFTEARTRKGGASYDGYLKAMIDAAWETCSPAEQEQLAELVGKAKADLPRFQSTPPKGPGRAWTLDAAVAAVGDGAGADLTAGHNLFHAIGCASCHYFAGEGGNHGPDLTSLGNKFTARDVLEAILEPGKVISDQYSGSVVAKRDGSAVFGRATKVVVAAETFWEVVPAVADAVPVRIPVADVTAVAPSPMSPMPPGLVNGLNPTELRDLIVFLRNRGR